MTYAEHLQIISGYTGLVIGFFFLYVSLDW